MCCVFLAALWWSVQCRLLQSETHLEEQIGLTGSELSDGCANSKHTEESKKDGGLQNRKLLRA